MMPVAPVQWTLVGSNRYCSKTACRSAAVSTLTYNYADSTIVLGPLSQRAEPHAYDLCEKHARQLTAPVGWEMLRLISHDDDGTAPEPEPDDLLALAHAVQDRPERHEKPEPPADNEPDEDTSVHRVDRRVKPAEPSDAPRDGSGPAGPARGRPALRLLR